MGKYKTYFLVIALILFFSLYYFHYQSRTIPPRTLTTVPTPTVTDQNIIVAEPISNHEINYIARISGRARVFENQFNWRIKDSTGAILAAGTANSDSPDAGQYGNYLITTGYLPPATSTGWVDVFDTSPKDGAEIDLVSVPVQFPAGDISVIKVFFPSSAGSTTDCSLVMPVNRTVPKTVQTARAALDQLLLGPTTVEKSKGLYTGLRPGTAVNSLTIQNGIAKVDFTPQLDQGVSGSCSVLAIRSQITKTLLQFPAVRSVVISINGRTQNILQP